MIKKGTLVKAWDSESGTVVIGAYDGRDTSAHRIKNVSGSVTYWRHAEPIHLMPALPEGVQIGGECEFSQDGKRWEDTGILTSIETDGKAISAFCSDETFCWIHCRAICRKEKRVKRASEIVKWFEEHGGGISSSHDWIATVDGKLWSFCFSWFDYCGKEPPARELLHPDWLEEVEA